MPLSLATNSSHSVKLSSKVTQVPHPLHGTAEILNSVTNTGGPDVSHRLTYLTGRMATSAPPAQTARTKRRPTPWEKSLEVQLETLCFTREETLCFTTVPLINPCF
jgi:hypothetical protein